MKVKNWNMFRSPDQKDLFDFSISTAKKQSSTSTNKVNNSKKKHNLQKQFSTSSIKLQIFNNSTNYSNNNKNDKNDKNDKNQRQRPQQHHQQQQNKSSSSIVYKSKSSNIKVNKNKSNSKIKNKIIKQTFIKQHQNFFDNCCQQLLDYSSKHKDDRKNDDYLSSSQQDSLSRIFIKEINKTTTEDILICGDTTQTAINQNQNQCQCKKQISGNGNVNDGNNYLLLTQMVNTLKDIKLINQKNMQINLKMFDLLATKKNNLKQHQQVSHYQYPWYYLSSINNDVDVDVVDDQSNKENKKNKDNKITTSAGNRNNKNNKNNKKQFQKNTIDFDSQFFGFYTCTDDVDELLNNEKENKKQYYGCHKSSSKAISNKEKIDQKSVGGTVGKKRHNNSNLSLAKAGNSAKSSTVKKRPKKSDFGDNRTSIYKNDQQHQQTRVSLNCFPRKKKQQSTFLNIQTSKKKSKSQSTMRG